MSSCFWSCLLLGKRRDACTLRCTQYRTRTGVVIGLGDDLRTLPGGLTQAEACGVSSPVRREPEGARLIVSGCWGAWCELLGWDNQSTGGGVGKVMWCGSAAAVFKQLGAKSSVWACCCYLGFVAAAHHRGGGGVCSGARAMRSWQWSRCWASRGKAPSLADLPERKERRNRKRSPFVGCLLLLCACDAVVR